VYNNSKKLKYSTPPKQYKRRVFFPSEKPDHQGYTSVVIVFFKSKKHQRGDIIVIKNQSKSSPATKSATLRHLLTYRDRERERESICSLKSSQFQHFGILTFKKIICENTEYLGRWDY
jgi:hypothetical protein